VDTGWIADKSETLVSNILTIWGMANNLGVCSTDDTSCSPKQTSNLQPNVVSDRTDVYTLSMNYDSEKVDLLHFPNGGFGIAARNAEGKWINAVDMNFGGIKKFVAGPWKSNYELGTYGVDPITKTAWAVINYNGDFAVAKCESCLTRGERKIGTRSSLIRLHPRE
jgi:hypothetical protein